MTKASHIFITLLFIAFSFVPSSVNAQLTEYKLLEPLPGVGIPGQEGTSTANTYIAGIFQLLIALAGVLAVLRLIYAGILYMSTDAFGKKSEAKGIIQNAIWGLLLAAGAWLIVATVIPTANGQFIFELSLEKIPTTANENAPSAGVCVNCVTFDSLKIPTSGSAVGKSIAPYFGQKLTLLDRGLKTSGIAWTVTEGYPPSVQHDSTCHKIGTCVDANISNPSATNINKFVSVASGVGLFASYEVKTDGERTSLIKAGANPSFVKTNKDATGPHFHVR